MEQATQIFALISAVFGAGTAIIAFFKAMLDLRQRLQRPGAAAPAPAATSSAQQSQARGPAPAPQGSPAYPAPGYPAYPTPPTPPARAGVPPFWRRSLPYPRLALAAFATLVSSLALSAANGSLFKEAATRQNPLTAALTVAVFVAFSFAIYFAVRAGRKAAQLKRWGWLIVLFLPVYGWIVFSLFGPTAPKSVKVSARVPVV